MNAVGEALAYRAQRRLRRTLRIALIVGLILSAVNQGNIILAGDATALVWVKCA